MSESTTPAAQNPSQPLDTRGLPANYNFRPQWEVTPRQVQAMRQAEESFILVDCRTQAEHDAVRIEGAELVPLRDMAHRADRLEEWSDRKLVIFCHHGVRSMQMAAMLREQGFGDVWSMAGGIDLWAQDIEPGMKRY